MGNAHRGWGYRDDNSQYMAHAAGLILILGAFAIRVGRNEVPFESMNLKRGVGTEIVDRPTQLIYNGISFCMSTSKYKDIAGQSARTERACWHKKGWWCMIILGNIHLTLRYFFQVNSGTGLETWLHRESLLTQ